MRILELSFQNLNSLYGKWKIDFTDPDYTGHGLFAITGSTGAGKSTLLDAICLALYGQVPRLGKITASSNDIMSHNTAGCFSELLFETSKGKFRIAWRQHRARKNVEGNLVDYTHEISDPATGDIIESSRKKVEELVEEYTGLSYERFTRSIMLAQGNFAAFLNAKSEERSAILEQITGTAIYSDISRSVYRHNSELKNQLDAIDAAIKEIRFLTEDELTKDRERLENLKRDNEELSKEYGSLQETKRWLEDLSRLRETLDGALGEQKRIAADKKDFEKEQIRLEKALRAAGIEAVYAQLTEIKKDYSSGLTEKKEHEQKKGILEKQCDACKKDMNSAGEAKKDADAALEKELSLIKQVRLIDQQLNEAEKKGRALNEKKDGYEKELGDLDRRIEEYEKQTADAGRKIKELDDFLEMRKADEILLTKGEALIINIESFIKNKANLASNEKESEQKTDDIGAADSEIARTEKEIKAQQRKLENTEKNRAKTQKDAESLLEGRLLRELKSELKHLQKERELQSKIAAYETDRQNLQEGSPCPLCGSTHHPYKEQTGAETEGLSEQIAALEQKLEKIEELKKTELNLKDEYNDIERTIRSFDNDRKLAVQNRENLMKELERLTAESKKNKEEITGIAGKIIPDLKLLGCETDFEVDAGKLPAELGIRREEFEHRSRQKKEYLKELENTESEKSRLTVKKETLLSAYEGILKEYKDARSEYEQFQEKRKKLYGLKDPDREEAEKKAAVKRAEENLEQCRLKLDASKTGLSETEAALKTVIRRNESLAGRIVTVNDDFEKQCRRAGFPDEKSFLDSRMDADERAAVQKKEKELSRQEAEISALVEKAEADYKSSADRKLTDRQYDDVCRSFEETAEKQKKLQEQIGALGQQLKNNDESKERYVKKKKEFEKTRKESLRWQKLNKLIGSADGKKYRNFAQGLTFENLIYLANRNLKKMSDRYLLKREAGGLGLDVVDNYQAGESRTAKNLSGGESFIVSLALALGLSKMASRSVRVDSLFLDEGFGTLDSETLEIALDTLAGLHEEGKLIGVISHVESLKNRIPTRIEVEAHNNGKSILRGPGVRSE